MMPLPTEEKMLSINSLTWVISARICSARIYMRALATATAAVLAKAIIRFNSRSVKMPATRRLST